MEFTVTRANNSTYKLPSNGSKIVSASQSRTLMGEDIVSMSVESVGYIDFKISDWITVYGYKYTLNSLGEPERIGENTFSYNLEFEGLSYELTKVMFRSADFTGFNPSSEFSLTGTLEKFLDVLNYNLERKYGVGVWAVGSFPATEAKTLSFNSENCLLVLNTLCTEFGVEYKITNVNGVNTISLGEFSNVLPIQLEYGKGKGLYSLVRANVDSKNIITRLYAEGSDKNIKVGYRDNALRLRMGVNSESYIDSPSISSFGIIEGAKIFDDVFPHREGTISAIDATDKTKFVDSSMNFDLAETDTNGTKWLLPGASAKIHFNSGNLAGYAFDLVDYKHATKTFRIKPFKDDRGLEFPNDSAAFQFKKGDKYVILNIIMPQAYITTAESELLSKAQEYLSQNDQPRVEYNLTLDRFFLQRTFSGGGFQTNVIEVGDYLHLKDSKIGVDKNVRVKSFIRDGNDPWSYEVSLSDVIEPTRIERLISDSLDTKKAARQTKMFDPARSRRNWRDIVEVTEMIDTLKAEVALIGSPEGQFQLDSFFELNKNGNPDLFGATAGALVHDAYEGTAGSIWNIGVFEATLTQNSPYYLYAKCSKTTTGGVFTVSLTKIEVDSDPAYYHFPVGLISSKRDNSRTLTTTYGYTLISGNNISTGIIKNENSGIMINLETGEIQGKFTFTSGKKIEDAITEVEDQITDQQIYIEYSVNGTTGWHTAFGTGDKFMRQKKGAGNWSSAIRLVGIDGTSGTDGRSVSGMTTEFYLSNSKTAQTGGSWLTSPPAWVNGKYLWTRVKIDYINPASTAYTTPSVSSEWEAVNDLEIGGRNLARGNTGELRGYTPSTVNNATYNYASVYPEGLEIGDWVTISIDIIYSNVGYQTGTSPNMRTLGPVDNAWRANPFASALGHLASKITGTDGKVHISNSFQVTESAINGTKYNIDFRCDYSNGVAKYEFKNLMVTKGKKDMLWTPAPEDVTAEIASAKQEALTAAGNAQSTANSANSAVGTLSGYVDGAFKDGVIDAAEAKAIEKYKNTLNEAMAKTESSYAKVYVNPYLSGAPKTALQNAKINLWGQRDTLISAINTAIAGGTTTSSQKAAVDIAFVSFNSLMAAFQNALEDANKAIQVKLDDIAKGYVDDLEIGGRNFIPKSSGADRTVFSSTDGYSTEVIEDGFPCLRVDVTPSSPNRLENMPYLDKRISDIPINGSGKYTFSFWYKTSGHVEGVYYYNFPLDGYWRVEETPSASWRKVSHTFDVAVGVESMPLMIRSLLTSTGTSARFFYRNLKLEKGTKATDWSPNPEDVPSALDYIATAIQDGSTDIEGGLVTTNVLMVKDTAGAVRGGMSGLEDNIGFWTGGSYQDALGANPTAKVVFRKDGSGQLAGGRIKFLENANLQVGDIEVDANGTLLVREGSADRVMITKGNITTLAGIAASTQDNVYNQSGANTSALSTTTVTLTGDTIIVMNPLSYVTVTGTLSTKITRPTPDSSYGSYTLIKVSLIRWNDMSVAKTTTVQWTHSNGSGEKSFSAPLSMGGAPVQLAGTYRIQVEFNHVVQGPSTGFEFYSVASGFSTHVVYDGAKRITEIGKNGVGILADKNNYSFFGVEGGVYKAVERVSSATAYDKPGVLLAGRMKANGDFINVWGAKQRGGSAKYDTDGTYQINHNIGHYRYNIAVTPVQDVRLRIISKEPTFCRIRSSSNSEVDFDIILVGNNQ